MTHWTSVVYFVAAPRRGGAPDINKAIEDRIFTVRDEADEFCMMWNERVGGVLKVYEAEVSVRIEQ